MIKFTILLDPFLVIISNLRVCLIYAQEWRRRFLKKYINFSLLPQNYLQLDWGGGHKIFSFWFPYPTKCYIPNLQCNAQCTREDKGLQLIHVAIGHLSDSCYLNMQWISYIEAQNQKWVIIIFMFKSDSEVQNKLKAIKNKTASG